MHSLNRFFIHSLNGKVFVTSNRTDTRHLPYFVLFLLAAISIAFKLSIFSVGAPYVTIDDYTLYDAGFLVWFGEAPPQRMYLESWIVGITSIATHITQLIYSGNGHQLGLNIVADAYRAYQINPDNFVLSYRAVMLFLDLLTAWFVFLFAKYIFEQHKHVAWLAVFSAGLYLLSFNTLWCNIVARPDTATAFFSIIGIYYYYKSNFGENKPYFYIAALALGCATGLKLHAALFVVFFILDLIRQLGFKLAIKRAFPFGAIAVFLFAVTAGSPLFDPLLYAKLRALNAMDDESPWIKWGDQFLVVLRGTGWTIIPIMLAAAFFVFRKKVTANPKLASLAFVACLFLLFFIAIRQLRAYWMLPALPLFYVLSALFIAQIKQKNILIISILSIYFVFIMQCFFQTQEFKNVHYAELKTWVKQNVNAADAIYILGYDTLFLPCNTLCLHNRKIAIERLLASAITDNEPFTHRHIRQWEERTRLMFIDMLNTTSDVGFNYYALNTSPLETLNGLVEFRDIRYFLVLQGYSTPESDKILPRVKREFTFITTANAPGGKAGTGGLPYDIYARKP